MPDHNFGPCDKCECYSTMLFDVTDLRTGVKSQRICCRARPSQHWRPATEEDIRLAKSWQAEEKARG